jgi:hypothetical protein
MKNTTDFTDCGRPINSRKVFMKRKTAQRFLIASGILLLIGGGSCFAAFNGYGGPDTSDGYGPGFFSGFFGIGALTIAFILGIIGLIGLIVSRREN